MGIIDRKPQAKNKIHQNVHFKRFMYLYREYNIKEIFPELNSSEVHSLLQAYLIRIKHQNTYFFLD